ncbi:glycosyltransferase family 32 protein [Peptostreptococcus porci]|uniref:glycosyltransferase family 32 protein n=1 Tax=Peptostreptococcus porci TaxID=2652282 RepID=UPI0023EF85BB|nr:glycosyltransferase [Peptostreptococcus porci]MDD7182511.1 glycosyltransferase [Peptostreptococcus porci]
MIPKKIHYVWVGKNEKTELVRRCIDSWRKYMPEYEIVEWNEENFDVNSCRYSKEAYDSGKWAFVSDYMRFKILSQYGGIYFDTDVELLKAIPESILSNRAFTGMEFGGKISPGLVYGCHSNDKIAMYMSDTYESMVFDSDNPVTVNYIITAKLETMGFEGKNELQVIDGLAVYPDEFFCGFDLDVHEICKTHNTISVHHYSGSWTKNTFKKRLRYVLKKLMGVERFRSLLLLKRGIKNVFFDNKK